MPAKKRATISDVAKAAGVSKQTISRVINDSPSVTPATREKILAVINELGYRRSELARNMNLGRSFTLAVVGSYLGYFGSPTYQGMVRRAEEKGFSLLIKELTDSSHDKVEALIHSLLDRHVDGILWGISDTGHNLDWIDTPLYATLPIPIVFIAANKPDITTISYDNVEGGMMATRHLIKSGRKNIGHITGPSDWWVAKERAHGWQTALQEAGLPADARQVVHAADWEIHSGAPAFLQLQKQFPEMDAVFAGNDWLSIGVLRAAQLQGIRIPEDLAVIGFDDQPVCAHLYPSLSTVAQDKKILGLQAIDLLIAQIEAHFSGHPAKKPAAEPLRHQVMIRESAP